jgi:hypothetical protein
MRVAARSPDVNLHELVVTQRVSLACDETRRCTGKDIDWKKPAVLTER